MLISNLLPSKQIQNHNQSINTSLFTKEENKTHNSSNDNNINTNCNISYQKTLCLSNNESNYDLISQTDGSTINNNIREIKVNISGGQLKNTQKNYFYQKYLNNQSLNSFLSDEVKIKKIIFIQQWWKTTYRIILIQTYIRGFLFRKNLSNLFYFTKCLIKLLFKLIMRKLRYYIKNKKEYPKIDIGAFLSINNNQKKNNNNNQNIVKNKTICKIKNNNNKPNNSNLYSETNSFLNKKVEDSKKITNKKIKLDYLKKPNNNNKNNPNNNNKLNFQNSSTNFNTINSNNYKCFNKNRNRKYYKENKEKEKDKEKEINNISNRDKLIAYNNIFNIYNNVKKYYENDNNINFGDGNYSTLNYFHPKSKKSPAGTRNNAYNSKLNSKKMVNRGSMKNINEKIIINKNNNINVNININNNPKTERPNIYHKSSDLRGRDSIYYLLKLKKLFLFWNEYSFKKKIVQKFKILKNIKTPNNIRKSFSIYSIKNTQEQKSGITSKRINLSNSLINIKTNKVTPKKLNSIDNYVPKQNCIYTNYSKKPHGHSNSVENNSMMYFKTQEGYNNSAFVINPESNMQTHNNFYPHNLCNNSVIIVSQYDRNTEVINNNNNFINDMKDKEKIYYFFAVINIIDKHNRRRRIRKYFNIWKSSIRFGKTFINSKGIEEKIICFKSIKSPPKSNLEEAKQQQQNKLTQNNSSGNFNFQTETNRGNPIRHYKANSIFSKHDLLTPNSEEKTLHPNFFKSNYKPQKIVYQKKFLAPKKMRNQSMHAININDLEDDRNITLINNNREFNDINHIGGNTFYNMNPYMIKTNANTNINTDYNNAELMRRCNIENSMGKLQEGRMNRIKGIKETEIKFSPFQISLKKNINKDLQKDLNENDNNKININIEENYSKRDYVKDRNDNNINSNKSRITTKQIILGEKRKKYKNSSASQEHGKNIQDK